MDDLFREYWWLLFPFFGMFLAFWSMLSEERQARAALDLLKTYAEQGKEPPPELVKRALKNDLEAPDEGGTPKQNSRAWTVVVFAAIAAGLATGYWLADRSFAWVLLIGAVTMGVLAIGALGILMFDRKR